MQLNCGTWEVIPLGAPQASIAYISQELQSWTQGCQMLTNPTQAHCFTLNSKKLVQQSHTEQDNCQL